MHGLYFLGWGIVLYATFLIDHFELFGLRQTIAYALGRPAEPAQFNRPELRTRVQHVNEEWRRVLTDAFTPALREYGFNALSLEATVSVVMTMAQGYALERLSDINEGHVALLSEIEGWMQSRMSETKSPRSTGAKSSRSKKERSV